MSEKEEFCTGRVRWVRWGNEYWHVELQQLWGATDPQTGEVTFEWRKVPEEEPICAETDPKNRDAP